MNKLVFKVIALLAVFTGISLTAAVPPIVDQITAIQKTSDSIYKENIIKDTNKAIIALENANMELQLIEDTYVKPFKNIATEQIKQNLERIKSSPNYKKVPVVFSETGTWLSHDKYTGGITTIFEKDGKLLIQHQYPDKSCSTAELNKVEVDGIIHYQTESGKQNNEYYMIEDNNALNLYGSRLLDVNIYLTDETNPLPFTELDKPTNDLL